MTPKVLRLLSTGHNAYMNEGGQVIRRFSKSANAASEDHVVPAPPAVIDYCKHMGGVDRNDQLRSYHSTNRKSQHWWKQVFFFLVDLTRVNSYICYRNHQQDAEDGRTLSHRHFTMAVAEGLIDGYSHGPGRQRQPAAAPVPAINFNGLHVVTNMGAKHPKACKQCILDNRTTPKGFYVKTHFGCPTCRVHLCPVFCFPR